MLRDGRCFAVRARLHDSVVRSIARGLPNGDPLREWLTKQVPGDHDHELGYAFVRAADDVHVSRHIDTRGMAPEIQQRFEMAIRMAESIDDADVEDVDVCLARLKTMLRHCDEGRPPLEFSDWRELTPRPHEKIGPGWSDD